MFGFIKSLVHIPYVRLSAWYIFYFAIVGTISPFLTLYLSELQFSSAQIGLVTAALFFTKIIAPNIWAKVALNFGALTMVRLGAGLAFIAILPMVLFREFSAVIVFCLLFSFFWNAILAQWETLTFQFLQNQPERYSRIRLWGSVGFSVAVVALGWFFQRSSILWFPSIIALLLLLTFLVSLSIKHAPIEQMTTEGLHGGTVVGGVICFLVAQTFLQISHGAYYTFFSLYLELNGYTKIAIGLLWALSIVAEVLMFICFRYIQRLLTLYTILLVSFCLTISRWLMTAYLVEYPAFIVLAQLLHAFSFAAIHACSIEVVRRYFFGRQQGQGQALYSSMGFGLGGVLGALSAGYLWDFGSDLTFLLSVLAAVIALLFIMFAGRKTIDGKN